MMLARFRSGAGALRAIARIALALALLVLLAIGDAAGEPPAEIRALLDEVRNLRAQKQWAAAESVATVTRFRLEESAAPDTLALAEVWFTIAEARHRDNRLGDSLGLDAAIRSVELFEASGEAPDSLKAHAHQWLGNWYTAWRSHRKAVDHLAISLGLRRRALGDDHSLIPYDLYNLGGAYRRLGELDSSLTAYREALDHWLRDPVQAGRWLGDTHAEIGLVRELRGEDDLAERAYAAAIRAQEERFGPEDPALDFALNRAAGFSFRRNDVSRVIDFMERSVRILERQVPEDDPRLLRNRANLAQSYVQLGDPARALPLLERAIPGLERVLGPTNEIVLASRLSQAHACADVGDTTQAIELLQDVQRASSGDSLRAESSISAVALLREAQLRRGRGEADRALRLASEASAINRRVVDPNREGIVAALTLQMTILAERADWEGVERLDAELEIAMSQLPSRIGTSYPEALVCRSEVADRRGRSAEALETALEAARLSREGLVQNVRALSDRQALVLSTKRTVALDQLVRLGTRGDADALRSAWDELVRWRGLVTAEATRRRRPSGAVVDSAFAEAHEGWVRSLKRLAQLEVRMATQGSESSSDSALAALRSEADEAERRLARDFPAANILEDPQRIALDSVLATLEADDALVGIAEGPGSAHERRLFALVARGGAGELQSIDLGEATAIAALVGEWKRRLGEVDPRRRSEEACRQAGAAVCARLWDPIAAATAGARNVFLVPEAPLTGIPWSALPQDTDRYLADEEVQIHVLDAERALRRKPLAGGSRLLALGGIDYSREESSAPTPEMTIAFDVRAPLSPCDSAALAALPPLPGTAEEVREIEAVWRRAGIGAALRLENGDASESEFKRLAAGSRGVLHLATHGIVLGDDCRANSAGARGVGGVAPLTAAPSTESAPNVERVSTPSSIDTASSGSGRRPASPDSGAASGSLTSGRREASPWLGRRVLLALANANHAAEHEADENEGLMTADEVTTLDLSGVEWVVLSACQSGAGEAWAREGVLGMQRAFHLAGARTVIASQWSVDDDATREWMRALYEARSRGLLRADEAMTAASRTVLDARRRSGRSTHAFFWAAFTSSSY